MKHGKFKHGVYLAAALALTAATFNHLGPTTGVQAQDIRTPQALERGKLGPVNDLASAASQTAAIVEGVVADIQYEYSEEQGPWTNVILRDVRPIAGRAPAKIEIRHFGGPLPSGGMMVAAELPVFVLGKQYIVFLRNTEWNVSAVVGDYALRVDKANDGEVVVNSDGQPVLAVGGRGLELGPALFDGFDRAGTAPKVIAGIRSADLKALDRNQFLTGLKSALDAQGLTIGGTFIEKPAGRFNWRRQQASASPDAIPPADLPDSKEPEADFSEKIR
jgi:hypothetical protein